VGAADPSRPVSLTGGTLPAPRAEGLRSRSFPLLRNPFAQRIAAWPEAGLDTAALLFFPLLVVLPRGIAALVSAAGLCAAGLVLSASGTKLTRIFLVAATLLGCLLVWGTASALWSVDPVRSLVLALRLAGLFAVGLALAAGASLVVAPRRLSFLLLIGMALGIAMVAIELATAGGLSSLISDRAYRPTQLNQASISFALLVLPASALLISLGQAIF